LAVAVEIADIVGRIAVAEFVNVAASWAYGVGL
jgi:hypothetical protein